MASRHLSSAMAGCQTVVGPRRSFKVSFSCFNGCVHSSIVCIIQVGQVSIGSKIIMYVQSECSDRVMTNGYGGSVANC